MRALVPASPTTGSSSTPSAPQTSSSSMRGRKCNHNNV